MSAILPDTSRGMTPSQMFAQRIGVVLTKACLSSIPFAALAFDLGQGVVDVANAKVLDRFLSDLATRIQSLETQSRDRLQSDPLHQIAAQQALRVLVAERDQRIAAILARAVAELTRLDAPSEQRAECARVLGNLSEPMLHGLQTYHRFERKTLLESEQQLAAGIPAQYRKDGRVFLGRILQASMPLLTWQSVVDALRQLGLLVNMIDDGGQGEPEEAVTVAPLSLFGRRIVGLCFERPAVPSLGRFAP